ncbi:hypothetical protein AKJ16_DCAP08775, partial [Drosera capensis]
NDYSSWLAEILQVSAVDHRPAAFVIFLPRHRLFSPRSHTSPFSSSLISLQIHLWVNDDSTRISQNVLLRAHDAAEDELQHAPFHS